jgi:hypothetical protein
MDVKIQQFNSKLYYTVLYNIYVVYQCINIIAFVAIHKGLRLQIVIHLFVRLTE